MSLKTTAGIAVLLAAGCSAGGYYWLRAREAQRVRAYLEAEQGPAPLAIPAGSPAAGPAPGAKSENSRPERPALPGEAPLREGEMLEFSASVARVSNVAHLRLQVAERQSLAGKPVWHLRAYAHTQNALRMIFELDDRFDSYSDSSSLVSQQYEMHLSERGQKVESVLRLLSSASQAAPPGTTAARVLPGTRDPLGMLQFLRTTDWSKKPEVASPVYDGHKLYEVRAKQVARKLEIKVPAGTYQSSKIQIRIFDNGVEMKDAAFELFLADDPERTPVMLEATMPFATAVLELVKVK